MLHIVENRRVARAIAEQFQTSIAADKPSAILYGICHYEISRLYIRMLKGCNSVLHLANDLHAIA